MNHSLKYYNCDLWLRPVKEADAKFYDAVNRIHLAICLADDIADRKIYPDSSVEVFWSTLIGVDLMMDFPDHWKRLRPILQMVIESERLNLSYIPGQNLVKKELDFWITRADLLDFYRMALSCVNEDYNKKENLDWFIKFKRFCLIHNDCRGLLEDDFEDLIQCRRNYVVLNELGHDGYFNWQDKVDCIKNAASETLSELVLEPPKNKEMEIFLEGAHYGERSIPKIAEFICGRSAE